MTFHNESMHASKPESPGKIQAPASRVSAIEIRPIGSCLLAADAFHTGW
ncbi:MAG: hypothetical protein HY881_17360 [Deltaproteobacteria bacterium]|nr:hypothetical protein [Deltaproteobacteria bacterium]